jgi:hypothetical protein
MGSMISNAAELMRKCIEAKCEKGEETNARRKRIQSLKEDPLLDLLADFSSGKETTQVGWNCG